jgi:hypothetical protein
MGEIVSRNELSNQLMKGVGGIGAGIGLLIVLPVIAGPIGYIAGGVLLLAGLVLSASKSQRKAAAVSLGAGIITLATALLLNTPIIGPILNVAKWIASFGLIAAGGFSLFKFFKNMKSRT